jgi:hypothetical protein
VPAIATVAGRIDYAQHEAAPLFRFAHARRASNASRELVGDDRRPPPILTQKP